MKINPDYLTHTLVDLVQIDSSNPSLKAGAPGEAQIGGYVAQAMRALGLETVVHELAPGRFNVVGVWRGTGGGRSLMWNAHMDTVGVEGMPEPFSARIHDGRLYGRGSQDMKGSLAAMLAAVDALRQAGARLAGDLILTGVADEEYASIGTTDILRHYRADAAIVTEPTDMVISTAHRGFAWYEVETTGRAAHGSRYQEGIDAILHMGRFLAELDHLEQEVRRRPPHPLVGPPSLHTALISGGVENSTYPPSCHLQIERRTCPGETSAQILGEFQAIIERLGAADPQFRAVVQPGMLRAAFEVDCQSPVVQTLAAAYQQRLGRPAQYGGVSFWTDAALLSEAGIPCVLLGPVGGGLHSAEEWVDLQSLADLAAVLAQCANMYVG